MKRITPFFLVCVFSGLILASCFKDPDFSFTPQISFNSISKTVRIDQFSGARKDSIIVAINFQDGDGDLGLNAEEIGKNAKAGDFNYIVKPFRKVKGKFTEFKPNETFSGFFPRLKQDEKLAPLEGKLSYRIEIETAFWPQIRDTVNFEIFIKDRAGNTSNVITSDPIIINVK